ncbi:SAC3/GANP/Nin1/mts3/eIF-3 p25 family-domain-containing protein [Xylariomycetidae sp. FL2044]|nr:SAC3/GANP/Nin1/mts3/eIF-3 p25 family-domain-containing protein [Xylariomycetidae sp. FL2044]
MPNAEGHARLGPRGTPALTNPFAQATPSQPTVQNPFAKASNTQKKRSASPSFGQQKPTKPRPRDPFASADRDGERPTFSSNKNPPSAANTSKFGKPSQMTTAANGARKVAEFVQPAWPKRGNEAPVDSSGPNTQVNGKRNNEQQAGGKFKLSRTSPDSGTTPVRPGVKVRPRAAELNGGGDSDVDASTSSSHNGFATGIAAKIRRQLAKDNIRPPKWPRNPGSTAQRQAMDTFRELYRSYRDKARKSLVRAKLMDDPDKRISLDQATNFRGTCEDMCPEWEQVTRIVEMDVRLPEKREDDDGELVPDPGLMVKRLARSAAGQDAPLPMDVRSFPTLRQTLDYMIDELIPTDDDLVANHHFLWDRTRAIRIDFSVQRYAMTSDERKDLLYCLETIARFHVTSLHLMSYHKQDFTEQQELEQLSKTLISLKELYDDCAEQGIRCENEIEFRSYYILMNAMHPSLPEIVQSWGYDVAYSPQIRTAMALVQAFTNSTNLRGPLRPEDSTELALNIAAMYFDIVSNPSISYTMACFAEIHFCAVRQAILRILKTAYQRPRDGTKDITPVVVQKLMRFDTEMDTINFVETHGLRFVSDEGNGYLALNPGQPYIPKRGRHAYSQAIVEKKRGDRSLPQVIRETVFEPIPTQGSQHFDEDEESLFVRDSPQNSPLDSPRNISFSQTEDTTNESDRESSGITPPSSPPGSNSSPQPASEADTPVQSAALGGQTLSAKSAFGNFNAVSDAAPEPTSEISPLRDGQTTKPIASGDGKSQPTGSIFGQLGSPPGTSSSIFGTPAPPVAPANLGKYAVSQPTGLGASTPSTTLFGQPSSSSGTNQSVFGTLASNQNVGTKLNAENKPLDGRSDLATSGPAFSTNFQPTTLASEQITQQKPSGNQAESTAIHVPKKKVTFGGFTVIEPSVAQGTDPKPPVFASLNKERAAEPVPGSAIPAFQSNYTKPSTETAPNSPQVTSPTNDTTQQELSQPSPSPLFAGQSQPGKAHPGSSIFGNLPASALTLYIQFWNRLTSLIAETSGMPHAAPFSQMAPAQSAAGQLDVNVSSTTKPDGDLSKNMAANAGSGMQSGMIAPLGESNGEPRAEPQPKKDLMADFTRWFVLGDRGLMETHIEQALIEGILKGTIETFHAQEEERRRKEEDEKSWAEARAFRHKSLQVTYFYRWLETFRARRIVKRIQINKENARIWKLPENVAKRKAEAEAERDREVKKTKELIIRKSEQTISEAVRRRQSARTRRRPSSSEKSVEEALLATGVLRGVRDEKAAARHVARMDDDADVVSEMLPGEMRRLEFENNRRRRRGMHPLKQFPEPKTYKEGSKTAMLRALLQGNGRDSMSLSTGSLRRSTMSSSYRSSLGFNKSRVAKAEPKVSATGIYWKMKARGMVKMPDGHYLDESLALPMLQEGKRWPGIGNYGLPSADSPSSASPASLNRSRVSTPSRNGGILSRGTSKSPSIVDAEASGSGRIDRISDSTPTITGSQKRKRAGDCEVAELNAYPGSSPSQKKRARSGDSDGAESGESKEGGLTGDIAALMKRVEETITSSGPVT